MMIILTKEEYDDLVQKATAVDALAEQKAEAMKAEIKEKLRNAISINNNRHRNPDEIFGTLREILTHY